MPIKDSSTTHTPSPEKTQQADIAPLTFPVVCLGASAGGLQALEDFFSAVPTDSGCAFVVVTHLAPDKVSLLPELIGRKTNMEVEQIVDGVHVRANRIFVIPPNKTLIIQNRRLQLLDRIVLKEKLGLIDSFLTSLASDCGNSGIGIILSGTGTDGSHGIRDVKAAAGMTMAQDSNSAKYNGMPGSAIATGCIDFVLPPNQMPQQLMSYIRHQANVQKPHPLNDQKDVQNLLRKIFALLRAKTNNDFSLYKKNTIYRRIERRMDAHNIDQLKDYVSFLQHSDNEASILFQDLLIGVTSFFRDPEVFDVLQEKYLPLLLQGKPEEAEVRIWVPGCSTGEEAYSIAIVMAECMEKLKRFHPVSIFATDVDEQAINKARLGMYPQSVASDISKQRLHRFFHRTEKHFTVRKKIRELVVFATQNIIKDPPFINLDILCCRNLLIYFQPELQKKLLSIFHYSLREGGLLLLGTSETTGQATDLFRGVEKQVKVFKRLPGDKLKKSLLEFPTFQPHVKMTKDTFEKKQQFVPEMNTPLFLKAILDQIDVPACVVINDSADIVYIHGRTGRFWEPAEGQARMNLLDMARPGMKFGLATAIRKVASEKKETELTGLEIKNNGDSIHLNLIIKPLPDVQLHHQGLMLIIFDVVEQPGEHKNKKPSRRKKTPKSDEVKRLEEELFFTRENLQTTIEELETTNEELKSTNEELQSTNEELQSTNEELETSKEELQSLNEESGMVNAELQSRIDELLSANDDIKNLLDATHIATIFLDTEFHIRRFTTKAQEIFPLTSVDIGRPISHFSSTLINVDLQQYADKILHDLEKQEVEVVDTNGGIYTMKLRPYRTSTNVIDGIVVTFENITQLKKLLEKEKRLAAVVRDSNDAITLQENDGTIIAWNKGAEKLYGYSELEALGMNVEHLIPDEKKEELQRILSSVGGEEFPSFVTERLHKSGKKMTVWLTVTRLVDGNNGFGLIATTERDMEMLK
ncbi:CheR family methyltransferase [Desulfogranum marinum]|uniref:CheR family methyltransferase n=1 Tax=Desulfogranum marinum TaxID=453220 RepID=UPI0019656BFC|nr:CheR family methyltransferase [Desulfogranum marinum]MBM9514490.1 PAS domain-containing protein [Desulfogranum marinum]